MADTSPEERSYRAILEDSGDALLLVDDSGHVRYGNGAAKNLLGCALLEAGTCDVFEHIERDDVPAAEEAFRTLLTGVADTAQLRVGIRHADGSRRPVNVVAVTRRMNGSKPAIILNIRDVGREDELDRRLADQERRFREMVGSFEDIVYLLDLTGRLVGVYGRWFKRFGLSEAALLGRTVQEVFGERNAREHDRAMRQALFGDPVTFEWQYDVAGVSRTIQTTLSPIHDDRGETAALVGVGRDVTDQRRDVEGMRLLTVALEQSPACVIMTDRLGNIQYVNPRFVELTGYRLEEVLGKNPRILKSGLTPPEVYREMWARLTAGKRWTGEFCNKKKSGELYWESAMVSPVMSPSGDITHYVAVKQDVTLQKRAELEAQRSSRLFSRAFATSPIAMVLANPHDGRVIEANEVAQNLLGFGRDHVGAASAIESALWPSESTRHKILQRVRREGSLREAILNVRRPGGGDAELMASFEMMDVTDEDYLLIHLVDLTEQRRAEKALRESEANYRLLFLNNPHPMWAYDLETLRFLAVNDAAIASYGYTRDEFLSMTIADIRPKEDVPKLLANIGAVMTGLDDAGIWRHRKKDGSIIHVHITSHTMTFDGRRAEIVLAQDVTERLEAERALRSSEERYRRLFEENTSAIFSARIDGTLEDCNPAFLKIFGFSSREEALSRNMAELYPDPEARMSLLNRLRRERSVVQLSLDLCRADGKPVSVIANVSGMFNADGELIGTQGYLVDDTERRKLERQLFQAQKMESLGTLAGGIAHDFNNILGIILAHSGLIPMNAARPEKLASSVETVSKACDRGAGLVRQLMTFARLNEPIRELVPLNDQVDEMMKLMSETFPKYIIQERACELPSPVVNVDPVQFHQVLLNLCVNARDAMMPNGGRLVIGTRMWSGNELAARLPEASGGDYAEVWVSDTGTGMDETTRARIFEPFFTTKPKGRGTGLGLSTVYGIIKAHGGFIDVESVVGSGTTFRIFLPATPLPGARLELPEAPAVVSKNQETVLLVEDEDALRDAMRSGLESAGFTVKVVSDADEALSIVEHDPAAIDVVLTDFGLPRKNGTVFVQAVRAILPDVPIVVASGFLDPEQRRSLLEQRVASILAKPVKIPELIEALRKVLDQSVRKTRH